MPTDPESFEDSLGNPDWASAGKEVSHSKVSRGQFDVNEDDGAPDPHPPSPTKANTKPAASGLARATTALVALVLSVIAPIFMLEFAPVDFRASPWLYLGLVVGGLLAALLQRQSKSGLLSGAAAIFGVHGAKIALIFVLAGLGVAAGTAAARLTWGIESIVAISLALGLVLVSILGSESWLIRALAIFGGLGYLFYTLAASGATASFSPAQMDFTGAQIDLTSLPNLTTFLTGFGVSLGIQVLISMPLFLRITVGIASPLAIALLDLTVGSSATILQLISALLVSLLAIQFAPQIREMTATRLRAALLRIAAILSLGASIAAAMVFAEVVSGFLVTASLALLAWALIQLPATLFRKTKLHQKSLGLSYGFYHPIVWVSAIGFVGSLLALVVGTWFALPVLWLLIGTAALGILIGLVAMPSFLKSQAEQLASEKRKNEPVRVSSEDLQWSE